MRSICVTIDLMPPSTPPSSQVGAKTGLEALLKARIDAKAHANFVALAKARKQKPSQLLRDLVQRELDQAGFARAETSAADELIERRVSLPDAVWTEVGRLSELDGQRPYLWIRGVIGNAIASRLEDADVEVNLNQTADRRFNLRIPGFLVEGLKARAEKHAVTMNRWIVSLVQSNLMRVPVLPENAVLELERSNRELFAIGRNINQIARVLNEAHFKTEQVKLEKLEELSSYIRRTRDSIRAVIRSSRGVWRDGE